MQKMISPKEFAALLAKEGVEKSPFTIKKWCVAGVIKATKIAGRWHIRVTEVKRLVEHG